MGGMWLLFLAQQATLGGAAALEGVMMKAPWAWALAVRLPEGQIHVERHEEKALAERYPWARLPLLRGVVALWDALSVSYRALARSAELAGEEELPKGALWGTVAVSLLIGLAFFIVLPGFLSGLVVAALFAAAMSTLDSGVNSLAAVRMIDFAKQWARSRKPIDDLQRARTLTVVFGIVVTAAALGLAELKTLNPDVNLIDLLPAAFNWGVGPLGAVFLAGIWFRRCPEWGANVGLLLGCTVGFGCALLKPVWGIPFSFAWVVPYAAATTLLVAALFALAGALRAAREVR